MFLNRNTKNIMTIQNCLGSKLCKKQSHKAMHQIVSRMVKKNVEEKDFNKHDLESENIF